MSRERLRDFLSTRGGGDLLNYVIDDGGDGSYDPGVDDLGVDNGTGQPLRPLIRDFLSYVTRQNDYPIAPGGEEITLTTPEGDPSPLQPAESTGAARVFVESNKLQEYSDSGKFSRFVGETGLVDKRKGKGGNELLRDVKGTGLNSTGATSVQTERPGSTPGSKLPSVVESILKTENVYSSAEGAQFVPRGTRSGELSKKPLIVPDAYGEFKRDGKEITFDDLRKIGTSLLLKAAQIDTGDTPKKSIDVDNIDAVSKQAVNPTDIFKSDTRVDVKLFEPSRAFGSQNDFAGRSDDFYVPDASEARRSYGTMNSPVTPFSGPLPAGMIAQALVGIPAVAAGTLAASSILSIIPFDRRENPVRGPFVRGRSDVPTAAGAVLETIGISPAMFGLINTRHPYIDCVKAGTLSFFGGGDGGIVSSVAGLAGSILQSPGFYVVIIRAIFKSLAEISVAFKQLGSTSLGADTIASAANLIVTIKQSKFIGYLNALAAIGDVTLINSPTGFLTLSSTTQEELPPFTTPSNRIMLSREGPSAQEVVTPGFSASDVGKSTFLGPSGRLAWRLGSAASTYLIPKTIFQGEKGTSPTERVVLNTNIIDKSMLSNGPRLPKETVADIESYLDAEYMPFYFHDLRTNEIIGFHAFLESLDDSFNIDVSSESSLGRLDNVQIYRGTSRSITAGFVVAATSEQDFDEMWFRINKLVTLAYPQWTSGDEVTGKTRTDGTTPKYKVPFSQVIGASPLIRLRIGDVIASNYSKFGLSRLFGATDPETVLGPTSGDAQAKRSNYWGDRTSTRFYAPGTHEALAGQNIEEKLSSMPVLIKPSMGKNYRIKETLSSTPIKTYFPIKATVDGISLSAALVAKSKTSSLIGLSPDSHPMLFIDAKVSDEKYPELMGKTISVMCADIMVDPDQGPRLASEAKEETDALNAQVQASLKALLGNSNVGDGAVTQPADSASTPAMPVAPNFFDPASNAVVRAFETTKGKGLAGMLTSLKFTWLDQNNTWEVTQGSRAPIFCRVSISMNVIHDLPLGLGHDGFMMSPAYPVGSVNRKFFGTPYTNPDEEYAVPVAQDNSSIAAAVKLVTQTPKQ